MIFATVDAVEYRILFHYDRDTITKTPFRTTCMIETGDRQFIAAGSAECSPLDSFEREVGRKLALQRAMHSAQWAVGQRTQVWNAYLSRKGAR